MADDFSHFSHDKNIRTNLQLLFTTSTTTLRLWSVLIFVFISACLWTRITCWIQWKGARPGVGQEPPTAPYWLPYFQHLPSFLTDPNNTFNYWKRRYPNTPFTLLMMNTKFHIFGSSTAASYMFSRSRDFVFEPVVASMMDNGLNLPLSDRPKFQMPLKPANLLTKEELRSREFLSANHSVYLKYLTSGTLDGVMKVYIEKFHLVLRDMFDIESNNWTTRNYHEIMRKTIFETSAITFFGTRLQSFWPNMWEDWKLFNDSSFAGVRSNASWYLRPRALMARERMLKAFDKWCDTDLEDWPDSHGIWNNKWGIKMNWEREALGRKFGFTHRGRACLQASFLFVIVTNSAPMATWFTWCVLRSPGGLPAFRKELQKVLLHEKGQAEHELRFDVLALKKNTYIQGVWKEALRTGSASAAARVVVKESTIEGFVVKPGSVLMIPVQLLHFDEEIFEQPQKIEPARWMIHDENDHTKSAQIEKQNLNLRSFGGGTGLCSGRFVAEQEIISVVSTIILLFDLEFTMPIEEMSLNPQSIGIMSPRKDPMVRMRRRKFIAQ